MDRQDSWVLEGLELPFVLFVATYALTFFSEKKVSWMVALAVLGAVVFIMIPNLKYHWFLGTAIDQHSQYGMANYVYNQGHIESQTFSSAKYYTTTPFIHLEFAIFAIFLNIPVVDSVKYLPVLLSPIYPLLTYCIIKRLEISEEKKVLKYALFISSLPISGASYIISGSLFGILLSFLLLYILMTSIGKIDRRYMFLFIFYIFILAATHSVSSVLLTLFLLPIFLLQKVSYFGFKIHLQIRIVFTAISISAAWLVLQTKGTLESMISVAFGTMSGGTGPAGSGIPFRFFELAYVDIIAALKTILVLNGADIFLLLLTFVGLMFLLKMRNKANDCSKFLFLYTGVLFLFMLMAFLVNMGGFRVLNYVLPVFPIFSGLFILHLGKRRIWMRVIVFSSIILLVTLQVYNYQPLIPSANVLLEDLPATEPLAYITRVNSIYQRQMVRFASEYINGRIASDRATANQIVGLTEPNFWANHSIWWRYYPLDLRLPKLEYDFFLIHIPGISGPFSERAETRTGDLILEAIHNSSIVYTNGESYVIIYNSK